MSHTKNSNTRPRLNLQLSSADKFLELIGLVALLGMWVMVVQAYDTIPDTIPVHYNMQGEADRWGAKENILGLPIVATVLYVGLTVLNRFPHLYNYLTEITPANARRQYIIATRMIRVLKLMVVIVFGLLVLKTIRYKKEEPIENIKRGSNLTQRID